MALQPGTKLGPYEIVGTLGAGGMGEVYRARDPRLGREVAVKVMAADFVNNADWLRRFEQEARATAALSHPNVLRFTTSARAKAGPTSLPSCSMAKRFACNSGRDR